MGWTGVHGAFAVETFFFKREFVIATLIPFRAQFLLCQNDSVLDRKSILL